MTDGTTAKPGPAGHADTAPVLPPAIPPGRAGSRCTR